MKYRIIKKWYSRVRNDGRRCALGKKGVGQIIKTENRLISAGESYGLVRSVFFEGYDSITPAQKEKHQH